MADAKPHGRAAMTQVEVSLPYFSLARSLITPRYSATDQRMLERGRQKGKQGQDPERRIRLQPKAPRYLQVPQAPYI